MSFLSGLFSKKTDQNKERESAVRKEETANTRKEEPSSYGEVHFDEKEPSRLATAIAEKIGLPYDVIEPGMACEAIAYKYETRRKAGQEQGFVPLLLVVEDDLLDTIQDALEEGYSCSKVLSGEVSAQAGKTFLIKRYEEYTQCYREADAPIKMDRFLGEYHGDPVCQKEYVSIKDPKTNKCKELLLVDVPVKNPWEVLAYIPFLSCNECPDMEEMLAICKYWYMRYEAVPVIYGYSTLEMLLPGRVPKEASLEAAKEHYGFNCDCVEQNSETGLLYERVSYIEHSRIWYFWWD